MNIYIIYMRNVIIFLRLLVNCKILFGTALYMLLTVITLFFMLAQNSVLSNVKRGQVLKLAQVIIGW